MSQLPLEVNALTLSIHMCLGLYSHLYLSMTSMTILLHDYFFPSFPFSPAGGVRVDMTNVIVPRGSLPVGARTPTGIAGAKDQDLRPPVLGKRSYPLFCASLHCFSLTTHRSASTRTALLIACRARHV